MKLPQKLVELLWRTAQHKKSGRGDMKFRKSRQEIVAN
jgi:hypothetical protein